MRQSCYSQSERSTKAKSLLKLFVTCNHGLKVEQELQNSFYMLSTASGTVRESASVLCLSGWQLILCLFQSATIICHKCTELFLGASIVIVTDTEMLRDTGPPAV